jgi:hypothetical protein
MFQFNWSLGLGDIVSGAISALGVLSAVAIFMVQQRQGARLQRTEIYQRLELASVEVFKFEAQEASKLEKFRDRVVRPDKFGAAWPAIERFEEMEELGDAGEADRRDPSGQLRKVYEQYENIEEHVRVARKYYEQTLNLFEMAARFRADGIMDERVFGSWVIWYFDTVQEWAFRWMWPELRKNYTGELRDVFNFPVAHFDWTGGELEKLQREFFAHVARKYRCKIIRDWLDDVTGADLRNEKAIASRGSPSYLAWPGAYGTSPQLEDYRGRKAPSPLTPKYRR